jgi:molybdopterin-guanine dinucleotide biosynthesis protein B
MTSGKKPIALGFYGKSESGKTTLLNSIIAELSNQGFRIAAIKKTDRPINLDQEGKDTFRFAQAGANPVVFSTPIETAIIVSSKKSETEIVSDLEQLADLDFIFIEGSNEKIIPKIRLGKRPERENTLFTYDGDYDELLIFIKDALKKENINGRDQYQN